MYEHKINKFKLSDVESILNKLNNTESFNFLLDIFEENIKKLSFFITPRIDKSPSDFIYHSLVFNTPKSLLKSNSSNIQSILESKLKELKTNKKAKIAINNIVTLCKENNFVLSYSFIIDKMLDNSVENDIKLEFAFLLIEIDNDGVYFNWENINENSNHIFIEPKITFYSDKTPEKGLELLLTLKKKPSEEIIQNLDFSVSKCLEALQARNNFSFLLNFFELICDKIWIKTLIANSIDISVKLNSLMAKLENYRDKEKNKISLPQDLLKLDKTLIHEVSDVEIFPIMEKIPFNLFNKIEDLSLFMTFVLYRYVLTNDKGQKIPLVYAILLFLTYNFRPRAIVNEFSNIQKIDFLDKEIILNFISVSIKVTHTEFNKDFASSQFLMGQKQIAPIKFNALSG